MYMMREYRPGKDVNKEKYVQRLQRNQGLSGRVTYDFDQRYFAEFNFGYNGTERLPEGDRFEFFPAVSVGWAVSNEKFWEPLRDYVDFLKIRGSYGIVGSDGFDDAAVRAISSISTRSSLAAEAVTTPDRRLRSSIGR